jgi:hypothetical protein
MVRVKDLPRSGDAVVLDAGHPLKPLAIRAFKAGTAGTEDKASMAVLRDFSTFAVAQRADLPQLALRFTRSMCQLCPRTGVSDVPGLYTWPGDPDNKARPCHMIGVAGTSPAMTLI